MNIASRSPTATSGERETLTLIAASMVKGTDVYGADGESIGSIYDVMIDKMSGRVSYAVLSFGGFLGMGEKYHPLPWNQLAYSEQHGGYLVNLTRAVLEGAPAYATNETPSWTQGYRGQIDEYYTSKAPRL